MESSACVCVCVCVCMCTGTMCLCVCVCVPVTCVCVCVCACDTYLVCPFHREEGVEVVHLVLLVEGAEVGDPLVIQGVVVEGVELPQEEGEEVVLPGVGQAEEK